MMVQVCEGQATKVEMMTHSIEQYKEVFVRARQQFHLVVEVRAAYFVLPTASDV